MAAADIRQNGQGEDMLRSVPRVDLQLIRPEHGYTKRDTRTLEPSSEPPSFSAGVRTYRCCLVYSGNTGFVRRI